jgi:hypothetical protein
MGRPGTFRLVRVRNRLDDILISRSLVAAFNGGEIFRKGLWGTRAIRPTAWETYPELDVRRTRRSARDNCGGEDYSGFTVSCTR